MNLSAAFDLAVNTMDKHGMFVKGWSLEWDNAKNRFGQCRFASKLITISSVLTELNSEADVLDTILHEIAHALVGPEHDHDWTWKMVAKQIGAKPERCFGREIAQPPAKYIGICQDCGYEARRYRMSKRVKEVCFHTRCRHKTNDGKIEWRKT
jgi:predicted SprT family Zn-dependent metalloprotease